MNKHALFFLLLYFTIISCIAQITTPENIVHQQMKRGVYLTYQEYLNNSPSVTIEIVVTYIKKGNKDSTIIAALYDPIYGPKDSLAYNLFANPIIWGFSDGKDVFVSEHHTRCYWKLGCKGTNPFFNCCYKTNFNGLGGLGYLVFSRVVVLAAKALEEEQFVIKYINMKGKPETISESAVRKLLIKYPEIQSRFKNEKDKSDSTLIQYLVEFNNKNNN